MNGKILCGLFAVSLAAVMVVGGGAFGAGPFIGGVTSVNAASTADGRYEYETNDDGSITITKYNGNVTKLTIPSKIDGKKVTSIGMGAFEFCDSLKSVTVPSSVTNIESWAFALCSNLTSVTIPDSVKTIGNNAFWGCKGLADKNGFVIVKNILFHYYGSDSDIIIPNGIEIIGNKSFFNCLSLETVTMPESVKEIEDGAFYKCTNLTSVNIPDGVASIGNEAFFECTYLEIITIPDTLKSIGHSAFKNCKCLRPITLPSTLDETGYQVFYGCERLTDRNGFIIINGVMYDYMGENNKVTIPDNVNAIADYAFADSKDLTSVVIPDSVTTIGQYAFSMCENLTSATAPDSVTSIGQYAFCGCDGLNIKGKAGSYAEIHAKNNDIPFKAVSFPLTNKSVLSSDTVILGKSITVSCAAKEGTAPYTYAVYYRKTGTTKWTTVQGYKTNTTVKITPKSAVNYDIRVAVKDANGKIVRKDMTLTVKKPLTNTSKLNYDTIKLGEKVKVRCFAENGETPYTFSVQYKKASSEKWVNAAINSTNNIFMLKPASAAVYDIRVTAKSKDGQVSKKNLSLTVTK